MKRPAIRPAREYSFYADSPFQVRRHKRKKFGKIRLPLGRQAAHPLESFLGVLPEEFIIGLFALLGKVWPHDPQAVGDKVPRMLANRPVAAVDKSVFPKISHKTSRVGR